MSRRYRTRLSYWSGTSLFRPERSRRRYAVHLLLGRVASWFISLDSTFILSKDVEASH